MKPSINLKKLFSFHRNHLFRLNLEDLTLIQVSAQISFFLPSQLIPAPDWLCQVLTDFSAPLASAFCLPPMWLPCRPKVVTAKWFSVLRVTAAPRRLRWAWQAALRADRKVLACARACVCKCAEIVNTKRDSIAYSLWKKTKTITASKYLFRCDFFPISSYIQCIHTTTRITFHDWLLYQTKGSASGQHWSYLNLNLLERKITQLNKKQCWIGQIGSKGPEEGIQLQLSQYYILTYDTITIFQLWISVDTDNSPISARYR